MQLYSYVCTCTCTYSWVCILVLGLITLKGWVRFQSFRGLDLALGGWAWCFLVHVRIWLSFSSMWSLLPWGGILWSVLPWGGLGHLCQQSLSLTCITTGQYMTVLFEEAPFSIHNDKACFWLSSQISNAIIADLCLCNKEPWNRTAHCNAVWQHNYMFIHVHVQVAIIN